jgi:ubiquinone biosynthesis protein COQ4
MMSPLKSAAAAAAAAARRRAFATAPPRPLPPIAVSPLQRLCLAAGAALTAFVDPARGDMVALLGELTGGPALAAMRRRLAATPAGADLLRTRPRIRFDDADVAALAALPEGTFGRAYAAYLSAHGFSPLERAEVRCEVSAGGGASTSAEEAAELAYILQRYREVHDFWHVLAGLPPSVLGETAVKWLEMVHTGLPAAALSALVAPARLAPAERAALRTLYAPWAVRCGKGAVDLMAVRYEDLLALPLAEVRDRLRFEPAPPLPG